MAQGLLIDLFRVEPGSYFDQWTWVDTRQICIAAADH